MDEMAEGLDRMQPDSSPGTAHDTPAIRMRDLRKIYNTFPALDGLTVSVPQGSFFGFLGPNGAGKTTTIRILTGLAKSSSGSVEVLGLPLPGGEFEIRSEIGLVADDSLLFDHLTGREYLEFVGRMYALDRKIAKERAKELLTLFELDGNERALLQKSASAVKELIGVMGI